MSENLTSDQKKFLEECEIEFSTRYTTDDEDYKVIYENDIPTPPIMTPWYGRPKLTARRRFGNRYNHFGYNNDYSDHRESREKNRDRDNSHSRYQYNEKRSRPY